MKRPEMIMRINTYYRVVERIYNSIDDIDQEEYDLNMVIKCCKGLLPYHGGLYSESGCIWRYVDDLPFLKANYDFQDTLLFGNKLVLASDNDRIDDANLAYSKNDWSLDISDIDIEQDYPKVQSTLYKAIRNNALVTDKLSSPDIWRFAVVQTDLLGNIIQIFPNLSHVYEKFGMKRSTIKKFLDTEEPIYNYKWYKYPTLFSLYQNIYNSFISSMFNFTGFYIDPMKKY